MTVALVVIAAVLGFAGGLFLFKVKRRWCPVHGSDMKCVECLADQGLIYDQRRYR